MSFSVTSCARGTLSQAVENHGRNNHLRTRLRVNYQVRVLRKTEKIQGRECSLKMQFSTWGGLIIADLLNLAVQNGPR